MGYLLYSITFASLVVGTILYLTRNYWIPLFRNQRYLRVPGSFAGDIEAGLSSSTFDLGANVSGGDGRAGLDDEAKTQILAIMKKRRLQFDEARRVYMEQRFSANGIGADGRPKDPKFVSFS
ncbi:protein precursor [Annulohypoxylon maeteangense]|uniref:protein precursor n=1 Tax=Annulohypoxylon maeteangense TaxID=1927788 RepID=UPI00200727DD|nr:protein precursor [Annulohypoxylon maeteangense]KAI0887409.1 protein precursor [Annulohypoxylon maeteangense]